MIWLSLLLLAPPAASSDPIDQPVRVEAGQVPVARAHSNCLVGKIAGVPLPDSGRAEYLARAAAACRSETVGRLNAGAFIGISKDPSSRSRAELDKILEGIEARFAASFMRIPTVAETNARLARAGLDVTVYDPVAPQYGQYSGCVTEAYNRGRPPLTAAERVTSWERAIAACHEVKARMMAEADLVLSRQADFKDPVKRHAAISEMFDGHDRARLRMAAFDWSKP